MMLRTIRKAIALVTALGIISGFMSPSSAQTADEISDPIPEEPPPPAYSLTLTEPEKVPVQADGKEFAAALAHVYTTHPQLKAERAALAATDESVTQALSGFLPTARASYEKGRERNNDVEDRWNYQDLGNKALQVTQPVFRGGATLAGYASAKDRVKAARAQLTAIEQEVLFNAVVAYTDVVEKQSVLKVNHNNVDVLRKQLNAIQARFEVGELTRTDVAQAQARLASAQAAERQALGNLSASRATFKRVIGYDAPESIELPPVPETLPDSLEEVKRWAEANHPVLEAARHRANAADDDVDVRVGAVLPSVNIQGDMTRRDTVIPGQSRRNHDQLTLNVSIPLYQSGAEWSRIREARNRAQQAEFTTIDTRYSVLENAARAWEDFNTAKAVISSNEEAVEAAQKALEGVRQEHLYGVRTTLDVLDTEQEYFATRLDLVTATVAEKQQAYRLLAAMGQLTAQNLKLGVDLIDPEQHYDKVKYQLIGF